MFLVDYGIFRNSSAKVQKAAGKEKKDNYLHPCLERRRCCMPLCYPVGGVVGKEAKLFEKGIASVLITKFDRSYNKIA